MPGHNEMPYVTTTGIVRELLPAWSGTWVLILVFWVRSEGFKVCLLNGQLLTQWWALGMPIFKQTLHGTKNKVAWYCKFGFVCGICDIPKMILQFLWWLGT